MIEKGDSRAGRFPPGESFGDAMHKLLLYIILAPVLVAALYFAGQTFVKAAQGIERALNPAAHAAARKGE
jgi:hypothetical protein